MSRSWAQKYCALTALHSAETITAKKADLERAGAAADIAARVVHSDRSGAKSEDVKFQLSYILFLSPSPSHVTITTPPPNHSHQRTSTTEPTASMPASHANRWQKDEDIFVAALRLGTNFDWETDRSRIPEHF
ncbi:hypothetical protein CISG_07964 [Coccidioides immitis RMSCC 3703]|uniref:Uncharacterized protein n=1 Tax=Coccidioides immitis RMSCC 3703 TaxID=454286 RepID=A0A0J8U0S9_COCIT|nr:hypothetical protein CISG_07964 [Coccidioides immitis RMSCC 3703]